MTQLNIVDISNYQKDYQPGTTGEQGVFVLASQGVGFTSPTVHDQVASVKQAGLHLGLYHFYNGGNTPETEADYFWDVIKSFNLADVSLILDYEIKETNPQDTITRFKNQLATHTDAPIWLYGSQSVGAVAQALDMPFWLAFYPYESSQASPATWDAPLDTLEKFSFPVSAWQFTTSGGQLDRSIFFGDDAQLSKLSLQTSEPVSQPSPQPAPAPEIDQDHKDLDDFATEVIQGKWGAGDERKSQLGDIYNAVQAYVNYKTGNESRPSLISDLATEVIAGHIGDGERRETLLGNEYNEVQQAVNAQL